jgi:hypothetical protein
MNLTIIESLASSVVIGTMRSGGLGSTQRDTITYGGLNSDVSQEMYGVCKIKYTLVDS